LHNFALTRTGFSRENVTSNEVSSPVKRKRNLRLCQAPGTLVSRMTLWWYALSTMKIPYSEQPFLHIVCLSTEEICRRWPARNPVQGAFIGFDDSAAMAAGWQVGRSRYDVKKELPCTGPGCDLCSRRVPADEVP
jgi:hypothetical protein